jgi:MORN repeat variant
MARTNVFWIFLLVALACDFKSSSRKEAAIADSLPSRKEKGKKNGLVKSYHSDGKLYSVVSYKDGVKDGVSLAYYPNGQVSLELPYANGKRVGQSKRFYESGKLYQTTEYKDDVQYGWQRQYDGNDKLVAELRFENDEPCIGLKEFREDGTERENYPSIVITPIDQLAATGAYTLRISMSDGTKKVKFYEGKLTAGGCFHSGLNYLLLNEQTGVAEMTYNLPPGGFLMQELNIVARVKTRQGHSYLTQQRYHLSINN